MGRLDGKTAIVTGAARGQGEAHARAFVAEGAKVVLGDILDDEAKLVADDLGDSAVHVHLDVTDAGDWDAAVDRAGELGPLNVLINNAGVAWWRTIDEETAEGYERMWRVNTLGPFLGIKAVVPSMRAAGGGSIVNTSSTAGFVGVPRLSAYAHSKWALRGLTRSAAIELGHDGIRVNSVHPGPIKTPGLDDVPGKSDSERFGHLPAGRPGQPEEVAALMVFLASDESSFITGTEVVIDGGQQAGPAVLRGRVGAK
jgi:3alpha(or 20beta)-hydroxysteroid dehydrogenase